METRHLWEKLSDVNVITELAYSNFPLPRVTRFPSDAAKKCQILQTLKNTAKYLLTLGPSLNKCLLQNESESSNCSQFLEHYLVYYFSYYGNIYTYARS